MQEKSNLAVCFYLCVFFSLKSIGCSSIAAKSENEHPFPNTEINPPLKYLLFYLHAVSHFFAHGPEIHGMFNELPVLWKMARIDCFEEWPPVLVTLHFREQFTVNGKKRE